MSTPANPLDVFRTYSYHHILLVCDGTETADELAVSAEITLFDHEGAEKKFCPRRNSRGRYIVLINGMSDTQFTISHVKWTASVFSEGLDDDQKISKFGTMATDGEIEILEPRGVNFFNLMNEVTLSLGRDANMLVFVLKTIFVGTRYDGEIEFITNIRGLSFNMIDITAMFDERGATYYMAFVGAVNGVSKLQQVRAVANDFPFKITKGSTLGEALVGDIGKEKSLEFKVNEYYRNNKDKFRKEIAANGLALDIDEEFIDVEYKIDIHPDFVGFIAGTVTTPNQQDTGGNDVILVGDTIEDIIDSALRSSQDMIDGGNGDKKTGDVFIYKISTSLESSERKYLIHYFVDKYKGVVIPVNDWLSFTPPDGTGITFDYIFTGKNIDVLSFDIKMQMGLAFFQTLAAASSVAGSSVDIIGHYNPQPTVAGTGNLQGPGDQQDQGSGCSLDIRREGGKRVKPLYLGMSVTDPLIRNTRFPGASVSYGALFVRHAAFENITANLSIRGNPQLMEETNLWGEFVVPGANIAHQVVETTLSSSLPADEQPRRIWPAINRVPGYVKVNVYMPNEFMAYSDPAVQNQYASNFWYNGWYYMLSIEHEFGEGEFKQNLFLNSIPTDAQQGDINKSTNIGEQTQSSGQTAPSSSGIAGNRTVEEASSTRAAASHGRNKDIIGRYFKNNG